MSDQYEYATPVFEHEETDGDFEAVIMECPVCGCREIYFTDPANHESQTTCLMPMACASRHKFDFIISQEDDQMVARIRVARP